MNQRCEERGKRRGSTLVNHSREHLIYSHSLNAEFSQINDFLLNANFLQFSVRREYYFSEENLMKDLFLRRKMDAEGFIPVTLIASFHRVRSLTTSIDLVIRAIKQSEQLELVDGFKVSHETRAPLSRAHFPILKWAS